MVGDDPRFAKSFEPGEADFGEQSSLAGERRRHHDVERAHPVGGDDQQRIGSAFHGNAVDVADLALAAIREIEVGFTDGMECVLHK